MRCTGLARRARAVRATSASCPSCAAPYGAFARRSKKLTKLRHDHPILRRGELLAPLHVDDHVVVFTRRLVQSWALTAVNNGDQAQTVTLTLPAGAATSYRDVLQGSAAVATQDRRLTLTVPPRFGRVLVGQ